MNLSKMTDKEMLKVGFPTKVRGYVGMLEWKNLTAEEEKERVKKFINEILDENNNKNAEIREKKKLTKTSDSKKLCFYYKKMKKISEENKKFLDAKIWIENN